MEEGEKGAAELQLEYVFEPLCLNDRITSTLLEVLRDAPLGNMSVEELGDAFLWVSSLKAFCRPRSEVVEERLLAMLLQVATYLDHERMVHLANFHIENADFHFGTLVQ